MVNVAVPVQLRDRIAARRIHHRQALHEIIEDALDFLEEVEPEALHAARTHPL